MATVLIVPGLRGSGPAHWQTWWQGRDPAATRVEQEDWLTPDLARWSEQVGLAIAQSEAPVWLVAHSFGCLATVHAAARRPERVAGALLVAPANPDIFGVGAMLPAEGLCYPTVLVASLNDPWMAFREAVDWSRRWGSRLVNLRRAGHINTESGYGPWPEGRILLSELQERAANSLSRGHRSLTGKPMNPAVSPSVSDFPDREFPARQRTRPC